jgi:hypothetical protein
MITQGITKQFRAQVRWAGGNAVEEFGFVAFHGGKLAVRRAEHEEKCR